MFRPKTQPEAIDLASRLLEYTPSTRFTPLDACTHKFFDELRDPTARLPSGKDLPLLFNFTQLGKCCNLYPLHLTTPPGLTVLNYSASTLPTIMPNANGRGITDKSKCMGIYKC